MNKSLILRELSTGYKHRTVAKHLNAEIRNGELTCLLGKNGIGKSTLLRTLSASQPPLSGEVIFDNIKLFSLSDSERARLISVVLTEKIDVQDLSLAEVVAIGRSPYTGFWGKLSRQDEKIVREAMQQVHIEDMATRMMATLSDGERQKVMIAKALAQQTPIILLDEPTAFLDFPSKMEIMSLLRHLSSTMNKLIFLSTHDVDIAIQLADNLLFMDTEGIRPVSADELKHIICYPQPQ